MRLKKILHKLLASYLLLLGLAGVISMVGFWFYLELDKLHTLTHQVDNLQITAKNIIGYDRKFLMYETINPLFYETGKSPYLRKHEEGYQDIALKMSVLQANEVTADFQISERIDSVAIGLAVYDSLYKIMIQKIKERGFKDYGAVGAMRKNVHQLEDNQQLGLLLSDILMLRRHEKDYIIRNDLAYAQKLERKIESLLAKNLPDESRYLLENYLAIFKKVVDYDQQIGTRETVGLAHALKEQTELLERILSGILMDVEQKREEILAETTTTLIQVIAFIFISAIIFSFLIANTLTRPLRRLSYTIDRLIETNFDNRVALIQTNSKDEVGKLTNNFNLMIHKLRQNIKELNKKHEILEEKNLLLETTNQKLADSEAQLREMNLVKDKFFSIISHDLRGPFNTLRGFLDILSEHADGFSPEEIKNLTKDMSSSVNNLYDLTNNLLQWALAQTNGLEVEMNKVSVFEVAEKNCELFQQRAIEKIINLENLCKKNVFVWTDKNILHFIFRNMISNALKFTEEGGSIRIICEQVRQEIHIKVIDSGVGISDENIERLFRLDEKFTTRGTRSEKGSGLGLLLCKEFLDKLDGDIYVSSELGKGTEFMFTLPCYEGIESPIRQEVMKKPKHISA